MPTHCQSTPRTPSRLHQRWQQSRGVLCWRCATRHALALLPIVDGRHMYRASLVLNKQANDVGRVIECYLRDDDPAFQSTVFDFIEEVVARERASLKHRRMSESSDAEDGGDATMTPVLDRLRSSILHSFQELTKVNQDKVLTR
jgi:hypothetical protein